MLCRQPRCPGGSSAGGDELLEVATCTEPYCAPFPRPVDNPPLLKGFAKDRPDVSWTRAAGEERRRSCGLRFRVAPILSIVGLRLIMAPSPGPGDERRITMLTSTRLFARLPRRCLSACLLIGAGACAKTPPQALPAMGTVTVGVTSRGPGVSAMVFHVSIEPGGFDGTVKGDVGVFTARDVPPGSHVV